MCNTSIICLRERLVGRLISKTNMWGIRRPLECAYCSPKHVQPCPSESLPGRVCTTAGAVARFSTHEEHIIRTIFLATTLLTKLIPDDLTTNASAPRCRWAATTPPAQATAGTRMAKRHAVTRGLSK